MQKHSNSTAQAALRQSVFFSLEKCEVVFRKLKNENHLVGGISVNLLFNLRPLSLPSIYTLTVPCNQKRKLFTPKTLPFTTPFQISSSFTLPISFFILVSASLSLFTYGACLGFLLQIFQVLGLIQFPFFSCVLSLIAFYLSLVYWGWGTFFFFFMGWVLLI